MRPGRGSEPDCSSQGHLEKPWSSFRHHARSGAWTPCCWRFRRTGVAFRFSLALKDGHEASLDEIGKTEQALKVEGATSPSPRTAPSLPPLSASFFAPARTQLFWLSGGIQQRKRAGEARGRARERGGGLKNPGNCKTAACAARRAQAAGVKTWRRLARRPLPARSRAAEGAREGGERAPQGRGGSGEPGVSRPGGAAPGGGVWRWSGPKERAAAPAEDAAFRAGRTDRGRARGKAGRKTRRRRQPSSGEAEARPRPWPRREGHAPAAAPEGPSVFGAAGRTGSRSLGPGDTVSPEDPQNIGCHHKIYLVCYSL
ncbi:circumsporozoite protein-like [Panthera pardus]|uniref:Circumsporozoite protein-like n=1 Tax=Panthera pardus TaxID=9691 RepID=A0A9W2V300_PANPR|nr:circumsporozoite protein-like [Panthera pardus]